MYKSQVPASETSVNNNVSEEPVRDSAKQLKELACHLSQSSGVSQSNLTERLEEDEAILAAEEYRQSWDTWQKTQVEYPVEADQQR